MRAFTETQKAKQTVLTFMHIEQKQIAIEKALSLLNENGVFALSIDKNQGDVLEFGSRRIKVYPDDPGKIAGYITNAGMIITKRYETDFAIIFISLKQ